MNPELFQKGLAALNAAASETQQARFAQYAELLKDWNQRMNLTAITDDDGIAVKHFLDSVLPLYYLDFPPGAALADIGTGAGFPGLPLKIMRPDLEVTLIDSLQKRVRFLETVCGALALEGVRCVHGRAEELGKAPQYRENFDMVASRAVANLKVLCEYCLPFIKTGGVFVALKAEAVEEELAEARPMIGTLGGAVEQVAEAVLPESGIVRKLVVIRKEKPTPAQFPRRANQIKTGKRISKKEL